MLVFPRHSHHVYTGRLVAHRHTSYALLVFLMMLIGVLLTSFTWSAYAGLGDTEGSASYQVFAVVPAPRPARPAIITSPVNGQVFDTNPITVAGTCPLRAFIKVFKNDVLAGTVLCDANGRFTLQIDLLIGKNDLTAVPYNVTDQEGPRSPAVSVTLNAPPGGVGLTGELILKSVTYYRGSEPGSEIEWPIEIVGGQPPYAVQVDWGDGASDLVTRPDAGSFTQKHTYKSPGSGYLNSYPLIIRATDALGHTAYLQLTTVVNAPGGSAAAGAAKPSSNILIIWPLWILLLLMVLSFWFGEWREKRILQRKLVTTGVA